MKRWKVRAPASVTGSVAARAASASHAGRGVIARQPSIHLLTRAPPASSARKRAGTATRPFSSTAWWYSPVNTCCPWPQFLRARMPDRLRVAQWRGMGTPRRRPFWPPSVLGSPLLPTLRHFAPLEGQLTPLLMRVNGVIHRLLPTLPEAQPQLSGGPS